MLYFQYTINKVKKYLCKNYLYVFKKSMAVEHWFVADEIKEFHVLAFDR